MPPPIDIQNEGGGVVETSLYWQCPMLVHTGKSFDAGQRCRQAKRRSELRVLSSYYRTLSSATFFRNGEDISIIVVG